jgi:hypothetical protein
MTPSSGFSFPSVSDWVPDVPDIPSPNDWMDDMVHSTGGMEMPPMPGSSGGGIPSSGSGAIGPPSPPGGETPGSVGGNEQQPPSNSKYWPDGDYIGSDTGEQDKSSGGVTWNDKKEIADFNIIGLPPIAYTKGGGNEMEKMRRLMLASMPVVELYPCMASFGSANEQGLNIFHLDPQKGEGKYKDILKVAGFEIKEDQLQLPIQVAFLNDGQIGESWSSSYGDMDFENMINSMGNKNLSDMRQITGASDIGQMLDDLTKQGDARGDFAGGLLALGGTLGTPMYGLGAAALGGLLGEDNAQAALKVIGGSKVDFPTLWQGSSYDPSYTLSVRLYNPFPKDKECYEKFILLPMAKMLAFCVPLTDSPYVYDFPLMCKAKCAGMFKLPAAVISSISIMKGGSNNDFSYQQQPSTVELQLTLQSLYSTMVAMTTEDAEEQADEERPTFKKYFDNLRDWYDYKNYLKSADTEQSEGGDGAPSEEAIDSESAMGGETDMDSFGDRVEDGLGGMTDGLKNTADGMLSGVEGITGSVGDSLGNITGSMDGVVGDLTGSLNGIADGAMGSISGVFDGAMGGVDGLMGNVTSMTDSMGGFVGDAMGGLTGQMDSMMGSVTSGFGGITDSLGDVVGGLDGALSSNIENITAPLNKIKDIDKVFTNNLDTLTNDLIGSTGLDVLSNNVNGILDNFEGAVGIPNQLGNELMGNLGNMTNATVGSFSGLKDRLSSTINSIDLPNGTNFIDKLGGDLETSLNVFDRECLSMNNLDIQFNIFEDFSGMKPMQLGEHANQLISDAIDLTKLGVVNNHQDISTKRLSDVRNEMSGLLNVVDSSIETLTQIELNNIAPIRTNRRELERNIRDYVQLPEQQKPIARPDIEIKVNNLINTITNFIAQLNVATQTINQVRDNMKQEFSNRSTFIKEDCRQITENNITVATYVTDLEQKVDTMREYMSDMLYNSFS